MREAEQVAGLVHYSETENRLSSRRATGSCRKVVSLFYDDETEESQRFTDQGVLKLQATMLGEALTTKPDLHYKGHTAEFDVLVSPVAVNDEYLFKQEITAASKVSQSTPCLHLLSEDKCYTSREAQCSESCCRKP